MLLYHICKPCIAAIFLLRTQNKISFFLLRCRGNIHWAVNGIAFAGDYLSAASFLGICGMIATFGFDGFLYSIGFLAGWIVALFLIAEPLKRLGKYTFTDALNSMFKSRAITLTAAISTLIVSIFCLIPQMVGAGDLVAGYITCNLFRLETKDGSSDHCFLRRNFTNPYRTSRIPYYLLPGHSQPHLA
jgi:Na+(H+)/acetate symporter ActP